MQTVTYQGFTYTATELERAAAARAAQAAPWKCAWCCETNPAERDPERPNLCRACPDTWCQVEAGDGWIVVSRFMDGEVTHRRRYAYDIAGETAAERFIAELARQGYPLRLAQRVRGTGGGSGASAPRPPGGSR